MTTKRFTKNPFLMLTLAIAASMGTGLAATKLPYDEIAKRLAPFDNVVAHRGITVTTNDGKAHQGRRLTIAADHLRIFHRDNSYEDLPKSEVKLIAIRQTGRFFHRVVDNATFSLFPLVYAFAAPPCSLPLILLTPPVLAYATVTTPVFLAADGIAFFIPAKVYEIVH